MLTPEERRQRARLGGLTTAARHDAKAHTEPARKEFLARFEREVDPDGTLDPEERRRRATAARKLYFAQLAFKSARARRARSS